MEKILVIKYNELFLGYHYFSTLRMRTNGSQNSQLLDMAGSLRRIHYFHLLSKHAEISLNQSNCAQTFPHQSIDRIGGYACAPECMT
jgi:hypothetical protein